MLVRYGLQFHPLHPNKAAMKSSVMLSGVAADGLSGRELEVVEEELDTVSMARTFWFNQDTIIPVEQFRALIHEAVRLLNGEEAAS